MTTEDTVFEYRDEVDAIAAKVLDQYPDDAERRREYISSSVVSSYWIVHYSANEVALDATDNEPEGAEVQEMAGPDDDWRDMRRIAASIAMERDVVDKADALSEEREEAESAKD